MKKMRSTTIIAVRRNGRVAVAGDGQVTLGDTVMKHSATKVRRLHDGRVITGFAGATADAFTLYDKLEQKLEQYNVDSAVRMFGEWNKNWQAIAAEMSDYTKRSFEESTATLEKLMSSKSVEQAVEIQTSYAKRACDDYMQQVTKFGCMYANMAKEAYGPLERIRSQSRR